MLRNIITNLSSVGPGPAAASHADEPPVSAMRDAAAAALRPRRRCESSAPRPAKRFRVCPRCPYFCRIEEAHRACAYCRVPLRVRCNCGLPITDPCDAGCPECGLPLREAASE